MKLDKRFFVELGITIMAAAGLLWRKWWKFHIIKQYFCPHLYIYNYYGCDEQMAIANVCELKNKDNPFGAYYYFWKEEMPEEIPENAIILPDEDGFYYEVPNGYILLVSEKGQQSWCWAEEAVEVI